jgi:hypothetical protein
VLYLDAKAGPNGPGMIRIGTKVPAARVQPHQRDPGRLLLSRGGAREGRSHRFPETPAFPERSGGASRLLARGQGGFELPARELPGSVGRTVATERGQPEGGPAGPGFRSAP